MLQWLLAHGCERELNTCTLAAAGGHFDVLKWARAKDFPWYADTLIRAKHQRDVETFLC